MEEYRSNSYKSSEFSKEDIPDKKIEKVVTGGAKVRKRGELQKFTDVFISEDIGNVKDYILMDVLIPAAKKAISDIVTNGIDMFLYGGTGTSKRSHGVDKVSYRNYYENDNRKNSRPQRNTGGYRCDDIILDNRREAEEVLIRMDEIIGTYGVVSVSDLYDLVDISGNYTDNKYGWTDIRSAMVVRVKDGYMIKLPKVIPLN